AADVEHQVRPRQLEEATQFAGRAAKAALVGPSRMFAETLDIDAILVRRLGATTWRGLSERQRGELRVTVRDHFLQTLAAPRGDPGDIAWSTTATSPGRNGPDVL